MIELFQMWFLVEILGVVCLPLTVTVFHNLPDRGWAFSKTLGLAVFAFSVWLPLMCFHVLPFSQLFIAGTALILVALNLTGLLRTSQTIVKTVRRNLPYILVTEAVFLAMVFLLGWVRSFGPDIRSFEMFMDEGFIAAIMRSPHLPPNDMWFSGYPINYYYYAHFTIAMLAKLIGQSPSIAFNTGICVFFGLTASNLFGVTCNVVAWTRHLRKRTDAPSDPIDERPDAVYPPLLAAAPFGLLTLATGLLLGNLAATQEWWQNHGDLATYDWFWKPTRVINSPYTINEFPAFSFLLSCFHAHVLTLAFTIMAIGMAFNLFLEPAGKGLFVFGQGWRLFFTLTATALVLGGLFAMNGWDLPTYLGLTLVCIALQQWLAYKARFRPMLLLDLFTAWGCLAALSFLLYVPFYIHFVSPAQGIGMVAPAERSPLAGELLIYGLFAFVYLSLLFTGVLKGLLKIFSGIAREGTQKSLLGLWWPVGVVFLLSLVLLRLLFLVSLTNSATLLIAASIALASVILLFYNLADRGHAFILLLGALAFTLIAGCEIFFLKDAFAGSQYARMNTVFKFYFQAWALLSIASGVGLFFILENFRPVKRLTLSVHSLRPVIGGAWVIVLTALVVAAAAFPVAAPYARYARIIPGTQKTYLQRTNSLDGLTYLATDSSNPGDYAAIRWLNANVQGDPVIIEAVGDDYSSYARISAFTGLPTPMGWLGHEEQWRLNWINNPQNSVELQRRKGDIDLIYTSPNPDQVLSVMARYHAQYLYVGPLEYAKYLTTDLHRFRAYMQVVYNAHGVTIYKVK